MKRIISLCCIALLLCQATALAIDREAYKKLEKEIREEMRIGGIGIGFPLGYVKSLYGEPSQIKWTDSIYGQAVHVGYIYSPNFIVGGKTRKDNPEQEDSIVIDTILLKDNFMTTPSGFTVGMPYSAVVEIYGESIHKTPTREPGIYSYLHGYKAYCMNFLVNSEGIITAINMYIDE